MVAEEYPLEHNLPDVHFLALAGHKFHAPKGVGALYIRRRPRVRLRRPGRRRVAGT